MLFHSVFKPKTTGKKTKTAFSFPLTFMSGAKGAYCLLARTQELLSPRSVPLAHSEAWAEAFEGFIVGFLLIP